MSTDKNKIPVKIVSLLLAHLVLLISSVLNEPLHGNNNYLTHSLYIKAKLRLPIGKGIERMRSILMPVSSQRPVLWTGTFLYTIFGAILARENGAPGYRLWTELDGSREETAVKYGIVIFKTEFGASRTTLSFSPDIDAAREYALRYSKRFGFKTKGRLIKHLRDKLYEIKKRLSKYREDSIGAHCSNLAMQSIESMIKGLNKITKHDFEKFQRLLNIPVIIGISEIEEQRIGRAVYSGVPEVPIIGYVDFETEVVEIRIDRKNAQALLDMLKKMNLDGKINIIIDETLSTIPRPREIIPVGSRGARQDL